MGRQNCIQLQNQQLGQRADSPDPTDGAIKSVHVSLSRERLAVGWRVPSVPTGSGAGEPGLAPASARAELATQRGMTRRSEQTDLKPENVDKRIQSEPESDRLLATDNRFLAEHKCAGNRLNNQSASSGWNFGERQAQATLSQLKLKQASLLSLRPASRGTSAPGYLHPSPPSLILMPLRNVSGGAGNPGAG